MVDSVSVLLLFAKPMIISCYLTVPLTGARWLSGYTAGLATDGSWVRILPAALRFVTLAIPFTSLCQRISEGTLNAVGPFYLASVPGEVKYPTMYNPSLTPQL